MKTIILTFFCFSFFTTYSQFSTYYNVRTTNEVNQKLNISGNINTIDFGNLALANALREKNRLDLLKYTDEKEKELYLSIAKEPLLAFDNGYVVSNKRKDIGGFKKYTENLIVPHKSLFIFSGGGKIENISSNGIKTEIIFFQPEHVDNFKNIDYEAFVKKTLNDMKVGEVNLIENENCFIHKKELERANVYSIKGFQTNFVWEDEFQYTITDRYSSFSEDGNLFMVRVNYYGNKKEVNFEQIEGRRFYFKKLIDKIISFSRISDYKF
jgi:hypothetical protein